MEISNNNLYSFNIDYFSRAKAQKESQSNEQKVEPDTNAVEKNESSTKSKYEENQEKKENPTKLTIDSKIKAHEMAHKSGPAASGGASFSYTKGPDGLMYAIAGEVPVEIKTGDTPQETISNMHDVIATALAPSDPSPQDLSMMKAQQEFTKEIHEQITNSNEYTKNAKSEYEKNSNIQSLDKNSNIKF